MVGAFAKSASPGKFEARPFMIKDASYHRSGLLRPSPTELAGKHNIGTQSTAEPTTIPTGLHHPDHQAQHTERQVEETSRCAEEERGRFTRPAENNDQAKTGRDRKMVERQERLPVH